MTHAEIGGSNPLGRTNSNFLSFNYFISQLDRALPLSMTHAEIGGSNPLGRTNLFKFLIILLS